jgi:hypothetical protein
MNPKTIKQLQKLGACNSALAWAAQQPNKITA